MKDKPHTEQPATTVTEENAAKVDCKNRMNSIIQPRSDTLRLSSFWCFEGLPWWKIFKNDDTVTCTNDYMRQKNSFTLFVPQMFQHCTKSSLYNVQNMYKIIFEIGMMQCFGMSIEKLVFWKWWLAAWKDLHLRSSTNQRIQVDCARNKNFTCIMNYHFLLNVHLFISYHQRPS